MEFPSYLSDGGKRVIIYTTNAGGPYPIHGAYETEPGSKRWQSWSWEADGTFLKKRDHPLNIWNVIQKGELVVEKINEKEEISIEEI